MKKPKRQLKLRFPAQLSRRLVLFPPNENLYILPIFAKIRARKKSFRNLFEKLYANTSQEKSKLQRQGRTYLETKSLLSCGIADNLNPFEIIIPCEVLPK